jgi:type II secretion system protein C
VLNTKNKEEGVVLVKKNNKSYKRKALLAIKLAMVLILGYVAVRAITMSQHMHKVLVTKSAVGSENTAAFKPASLPSTSVQDYSAIVEQDIFRSSAPALVADKALQVDNSAGSTWSGEEELGIALLGTVAGSPEISRAIIKDLKNNVLNVYKTGDTVVTAYVESIEKDGIVLLHQGQRRKINLRTKESEKQDTVIPEVTMAKNATQPVEAHPAAKSNPTFTDKLRYAATMIPKVKIEPHTIDGQVEGLRISGLEDIKGAEDLGLKNGDVIRAVNGQRLDSKQKAYQISRKARSQTAMNVEFMRDNKIKAFSFSLR